MQENDIQNNYIEKIILDDKAEIPVSCPNNTDKEGRITVICGKNHSGKSYILKKISEALKEGRNYNDGTLECNGTNLKVEFSDSGTTLPEVKKILSIGDPTSTKRIYEDINNITFKELRDQKIFTGALYFNDEKNIIFQKLVRSFVKGFSKYYVQIDDYRYFRSDYFAFSKGFFRRFRQNHPKYFQKDLSEDFQKDFSEDFQKYFTEDFQKYFTEDFQKYFTEDFQKDSAEFSPKIFSTFFNSALIQEHDEFRTKIDDFDKYIEDKNEKFNVYDNIYLCKQDNLLVKKFQKAVQGHLYFGAAKDETSLPTFVIRSYDGNRTLRYTDWSDGQKTLFTSLLEINYIKPEILLIDEIETHYHPDYISQLLGFIKGTAKQSIIVTHHPHVIFSWLVDKVIYIDTNTKKDDEKENDKEKNPAKTLPIEEEIFENYTYQREIKELNTDFDKIGSAYALFNQNDHQILQLTSLFTGDDWNKPLK